MDEENNQKQKGLKSHTIVFMIVVALFFDVLQWFLTFVFMGWLASIFAFLTFYVWFKLYGISFMTPKRAMAMGAGFIIELIPILNILPGWTVVVIYLTLEEKARNVVSKVPGGQIVANAIPGGKSNVVPFRPRQADSSTDELKKAA